MIHDLQRYDVAIVGGGLAGLTAATVLAGAGRSVVVLERAAHVGGRAITRASGAWRFNLGPHAIYRSGAALPILRELGIPFSGGNVPSDAKLVRSGRLLSMGSVALGGRLLTPRAKLAALRFFAALPRMDTAALDHMPLAAWAATALPDPGVRGLVISLIRLASYVNAPEQMSAGAALAQFKQALGGGVLYVDGGWQTLVDGLSAAAEAAGARIITGARVAALECDDAVRAVRLADGTAISVGAAILAVGPAEAAQLVAGRAPSLERWAGTAQPVRLATLDLALTRLPRPANRIVLGIERPLYLSVHSAWARLAPEGGALVHVSRYLAPGEGMAEPTELEQLLDLAQPGWRSYVAERHFYPNLTVANALPTAVDGGLRGRPDVAVSGVANLYVAGDWAGQTGLLSDAAVASGRAAAALIVQRPRRQFAEARSYALA